MLCARPVESKGLFNLGDLGKELKKPSGGGKAELEYTKAIMETLEFVLRHYKSDNGMFPSTEQGLQALVKPPELEPVPPNWRGPYIGRVPKDAWERPFHYVCPGEHNTQSYDLSSYGPDGVESFDDIRDWDQP